MSARPVLTIARLVGLEALRARLPWLALGTLAVLAALAFFAQSLATTESARIQTAAFAATARLAAVFILTVHVAGSLAREFDDKGLEFLLAFDLPRFHYILGKLAGFTAVAWLLAGAVTLVMLALAPGDAAVQWGIALALELTLVAAAALFAMVTFSRLLPATVFVLAFYLLARSLTAMQLMSGSPLAGTGSAAQRLIAGAVDLLALVVPALDRYAQTAWLVDAPPGWAAIAGLALQAAVYGALLAAAAMFDFHRRNL